MHVELFDLYVNIENVLCSALRQSAACRLLSIVHLTLCSSCVLVD